jgi:hypothetical protein
MGRHYRAPGPSPDARPRESDGTPRRADGGRHRGLPPWRSADAHHLGDERWPHPSGGGATVFSWASAPAPVDHDVDDNVDHDVARVVSKDAATRTPSRIRDTD